MMSDKRLRLEARIRYEQLCERIGYERVIPYFASALADKGYKAVSNDYKTGSRKPVCRDHKAVDLIDIYLYDLETHHFTRRDFTKSELAEAKANTKIRRRCYPLPNKRQAR